MNFIDVHNHSLPGIDDGAVDLAMALDMLRAAEATGTTEVVLTPHHLNGVFTNYADQIFSQVEIMRQKVELHGINLKLHVASEIHLVPETVDQILTGKALTYGNHRKAALIELPKNNIPAGTEVILSQLVDQGVTPVIAHPERNSLLRRDVGPLKEWVEFGCKSQLTGQSCSGAFGEGLKKFSQQLIAAGLVHLVASDAHRVDGRSPRLDEAARAISRTFGEQVSEMLLRKNPARLVAGEDLNDLNAVCGSEPKRRLFGSWRNKRRSQPGRKKGVVF